VPHVVVTAVGADQPGIVAAVTGALLDHGANLEDTAMTRLGGHFAMVLVVEVPGREDADALERALVDATGALGLTITVRPIADAAAAPERGEPWSVTVHGADQPGIVHRVTSVLAELGANIVDLSTRRITSDAGTGYVVLLEVLVESDPSAALGGLADDLGVDITARPDEADVL
jgi:glycine cleavage system transcriptional repressor